MVIYPCFVYTYMFVIVWLLIGFLMNICVHMYTHLPKQCKSHLLSPFDLGISQLVREYPVVSSSHILIQQMGVQEITIMKCMDAYMYVMYMFTRCMYVTKCMYTYLLIVINFKIG